MTNHNFNHNILELVKIHYMLDSPKVKRHSTITTKNFVYKFSHELLKDFSNELLNDLTHYGPVLLFYTL